MGYTTFSYVTSAVASPQQLLLQQRAYQQANRRQDQALRVPDLRAVQACAVICQLFVLHHLIWMVRVFFCRTQKYRYH